MSDGPVQDLIDQLKLMRVELGDVKKRQLTEERLKHLQAALEDNAKKNRRCPTGSGQWWQGRR